MGLPSFCLALACYRDSRDPRSFDASALEDPQIGSLCERVRLIVDAQNYYNPLGPCGSPNRLPDSVIGTEVPCEGLELIIDNYRFAEVPRIVDNDGESYRILAGLQGTFGNNWDWDSAVLYNKAEKNEVTRNRPANSLLAEALFDPDKLGKP